MYNLFESWYEDDHGYVPLSALPCKGEYRPGSLVGSEFVTFDSNSINLRPSALRRALAERVDTELSRLGWDVEVIDHEPWYGKAVKDMVKRHQEEFDAVAVIEIGYSRTPPAALEPRYDEVVRDLAVAISAHGRFVLFGTRDAKAMVVVKMGHTGEYRFPYRAWNKRFEATTRGIRWVWSSRNEYSEQQETERTVDVLAALVRKCADEVEVLLER